MKFVYALLLAVVFAVLALWGLGGKLLVLAAYAAAIVGAVVAVLLVQKVPTPVWFFVAVAFIFGYWLVPDLDIAANVLVGYAGLGVLAGLIGVKLDQKRSSPRAA